MSEQKNVTGLKTDTLSWLERKLSYKHSWNHEEFSTKALKIIMRERGESQEKVKLVSGKHNEKAGRKGRESRIGNYIINSNIYWICISDFEG